VRESSPTGAGVELAIIGDDAIGWFFAYSSHGFCWSQDCVEVAAQLDDALERRALEE